MRMNLAVPDSRMKDKKTRLLLLMVCLLTNPGLSSSDKLSPDHKAPPFALLGAGAELSLEPPLEGPVKSYASILKETNRPNIGDGEYAFSFQTEDGVQREEVGKLKKVGEELVTVVKGRYSYTSPEGLAIDVRYSADENGARSSFTFGTDPGRWRQSLSLPGLGGSRVMESLRDEGKFGSVTAAGGEKDRGYLPPVSKPERITNEYLPPPGKR